MKVTKTKPKAIVAAPSKAKKTVSTPVTPKAKPAGMLITAVKTKATALGLTPGKLTKVDLILAIQKAEKNTPCFGTGTPACPYTDCCWRVDCVI